ncbi:MAG: hypothetical protein ISR34_11875 [Pirellulales bacterium]|nr:hypothetical protein [Pirellulales bacterium]
MIAQAAVNEASKQTGLAEQVRIYIATAQELAEDGLTLAEFSELVIGGVRIGISALDAMRLDGSDKKAIAVDIALQVFDALDRFLVPVWLLPFWFVIRPAARAIAAQLAAGAVETLLPLLRV